MAYIHVEYHSAIKKDEILPFATTWMDPEGMVLSDVDGPRGYGAE